MAVALHVYIREKGAAGDDPISVEHVFYGRTEVDADRKRLAHLAGDENYALADVERRTAETIDDLPDAEVPAWADVEAEGEEPEDEGVIDVHGKEATESGDDDPEDEGER